MFLTKGEREWKTLRQSKETKKMDCDGNVIGGKHRIDGPLYAAEKRLKQSNAVPNVFKYVYSDLVFPTIPNGPRCKYIDSQPWCPNNFTGLVSKCIEELKKSRSDVIMELSEIIHNIKQKVNTEGFNIYLLPWKPFSLIGEIEIDEKIRNNPILYPKVKSKEGAISYIILQSLNEGGEIMSVLRRDEYFQCMKDLSDAGVVLQDPLTSASENEEWIKRLHINKIDTKFSKFSIAQYIISKSMWYNKAVNMLQKFRSYEPLFLGDESPIEINQIVRLQTASRLFHYDYDIEKYSNNMYIRVPKTLRNKVVEFINKNGGRCSLNSLVRELRETYQLDSGYFAKVIWLLRHVSQKAEDLTLDKHQLIFARNINERDEMCTLSGDSLDFTGENLGRFFWRSLSSLEKRFDVDLTKYENKTAPVRTICAFCKHVIICFPYGCDMRHIDDLYTMCPSRFTTETDVIKHVRSDHGISRYDEEIVEKVTQNKDLINFVKNESEEDWVGRNLSCIENNKNVGQLLVEFIKEILTKRQWRSSLRRCLNNLEDMTESKTTILKSQINEDTGVKREMQEQKKLLNISRRFLDHYDTLLLKPQRINHLLDRLYKELVRQQNVLKDYVDMCREQRRTAENASTFGKILTEDHSKLLLEAGINVATGSNYVNMIQRNDCKNQDDNSVVVALAMINAIHQHDYMAADKILKMYQDKLDRADCDLTKQFLNLNSPNEEGEKMSNDIGMVDISHDISRPRRDDHDDDEGGLQRIGGLGGVGTGSTQTPNADQVAIYKKLKSYEKRAAVPMTITQFQNLTKAEPRFAIDARHLSVYDISKFLKHNMLPGNNIIHVGKGFDQSTTTYELIDPTKIYVNLADFKGLLFQFLYLLRYGEKKRILYRNKIHTVFLNIINTMFLLNDTGFSTFDQAISKALAVCFENQCFRSPVKYETKKKVWEIFVNSIRFLNGNRFGSMNGFFAVRLCRHGDFSGTPVKIMTGEKYVMPCGTKLPSIAICLDNILQTTHNEIHHVATSNNKLLFEQQANLISKLREEYRMEIKNISFGSKTTGLIDFQPTSIKKVGMIFPAPCSSVVANESLHPNDYKLSIEDIPSNVDFKTGCNPKRSYDSIPSYVMTGDDLTLYEQEIDEWREKDCCICLEPFSTRPLEGLNCMYRKLENDFRALHGISRKIIWEQDRDLLQKYIEFASEKIEDAHRIDKGVTANGMHMFHRDCIRRHIHFSALDISTRVIACPMCKIEIYDEYQKNVILANINEIACRLATEMDSPNITTYTTGDMMNVKCNAETDDENGLLSYFGCHYVSAETDDSQVDRMLRKQLEEKSNMTYFKKELKELNKDENKLKEYEEKLKMYLSILVYQRDFSIRHAKDMIKCDDNERLETGFQNVLSVGRQCVA